MKKKTKKHRFLFAVIAILILIGMGSVGKLSDEFLKKNTINAIMTALIIVLMMAGLEIGTYICTDSYDEEKTQKEKQESMRIGSIILWILLFLSSISTTLELICHPDWRQLLLVPSLIANIVSQVKLLLINVEEEFKTDVEEKAKDDFKKDKKNKENDSKSNNENIEEILTFDILIKKFKEIGKACPNAAKQMDWAINQIGELDNIATTIKEIEKLAYRKTILNTLTETYEHVVGYVFQNLRDVLTVCVAGQALKNHKLRDSEIKTINKELKSNDTKIEMFNDAISKATANAIQQNDAFSDLDIDSEILSIGKYIDLKNGNSCFTTTTTPPQTTGTR